MTEHYFFIPCIAKYWQKPEAFCDPSHAGDELAWVRDEATRALAVAKRLFPDVQFRLCEEPPHSQTYERGSLNHEIRRVLELGTALRFDPPGQDCDED